MTANTTQGSNVLPFTRPVKRSAPAVTAVSDLHELLIVHDHLIALLRETDDEGLDMLADSIVQTVVRCREELSRGLSEQDGQKIVRELRDGLRQVPGNLRSLLPGIGPRLGESMERKLGVQFSEY